MFKQRLIFWGKLSDDNRFWITGYLRSKSIWHGVTYHRQLILKDQVNIHPGLQMCAYSHTDPSLSSSVIINQEYRNDVES